MTTSAMKSRRLFAALNVLNGAVQTVGEQVGVSLVQPVATVIKLGSLGPGNTFFLCRSSFVSHTLLRGLRRPGRGLIENS